MTGMFTARADGIVNIIDLFPCCTYLW